MRRRWGRGRRRERPAWARRRRSDDSVDGWDAIDGVGCLGELSPVAGLIGLVVLVVVAVVFVVQLLVVAVVAAVVFLVGFLWGGGWVVEAKRPSGSVMRWRVGGWRASGAFARDLRERIAAGTPLPPADPPPVVPPPA